MSQQYRRAEYFRGRIGMLTARKQELLGRASAVDMDPVAREQLAERLDEIISMLQKCTAELAELETEA